MSFKFDDITDYTVVVSAQDVPGGLVTESFPLSISIKEQTYYIEPTDSVRDMIMDLIADPAFRSMKAIHDTVYIHLLNSKHVFSTGKDYSIPPKPGEDALEFAIEYLSNSRHPRHWSRTLMVTPTP